MMLMLVVVICYTLSSLGDKTAVAKYKLNGNELTFMMAASISVYLLFYLPFDSRLITFSWQSIAAVLFMTSAKMAEFQLSAIILREMSAFELKAWIGTTLFLSYATDIITGTAVINSRSPAKLGFIAVTAAGLFLIARSGSGSINYKRIIVPLVGYLASKFGYGLVVNLTKSYISPTVSLFISLVILTVILIPKAKPIKMIKEKTKGAVFFAAAKIPNVVGLVCENIVASQSITNYTFIQPMILVVLFALHLLKREGCTRLNIAGGVICAVGIIGFQLI